MPSPKYIIAFQLLGLSLFFCILTSCKLPYTDDIKYLDIDSTFKTPTEKKQFEKLKTKFLNLWMDTSNCYVQKPSCPSCPWEVRWKYPRDIHIGNILHTPNYDTLLVLVTWYSAEYDSSGKVWEENTTAIGMGAIIDSSDSWHFQCDFKIINKFDGKFIGYGSGGTYWLEGSDIGGNQCKELEIHLKRLIIKGGYLKSDKSPDPTFWERLYNDDDIWKNGSKGTK